MFDQQNYINNYIKNSYESLKVRLRKLAEIISKIGYIGAALVFFSHLF